MLEDLIHVREGSMKKFDPAFFDIHAVTLISFQILFVKKGPVHEWS